MVVANAVAALADIRETSARNAFTLNTQSLQKLLRALNECTEWGQVRVLLTTPTSHISGTALLARVQIPTKVDSFALSMPCVS